MNDIEVFVFEGNLSFLNHTMSQLLKFFAPNMIYKDIDYVEEYGLIVGWPLRCLVPALRFTLSWGLLVPAFAVAIVGFILVGFFMLVIEIVKLLEMLGRRKIYDGAQVPEVQGGMEQLVDRPVLPDRGLPVVRVPRSRYLESNGAFRSNRWSSP